MAIYGTAILSVCLLAGLMLGKLPGFFLDRDLDMGGVGLAMVFLILVTHRLRKSAALAPATAAGIEFWSAIYIPVVVAMACSLNVRGAIGGGVVAMVAGVLTVTACFLLVPLISRLAPKSSQKLN